MNFTDAEKARLKVSARKHVLGHWMDNADLDKGVKIFTRGKGCRITDIDGNRYRIADFNSIEAKSRRKLEPYLY